MVSHRALVQTLRQDLHRERRRFASLLGVPESSPQFVAWQSEVAHVVSKNPRLLEADRPSLMQALASALTRGLSINPDMGEAWLIPRWDKNARANLVQCQTGYRGMVALMYRSEQVDRVHADVVYRGEHFIARGGTDPGIDHIPDVFEGRRTGDFEDMVCAYACVWIRGSRDPIHKVITRRDMEVARGMNLDRNGNPSTPWRDHTEAMVWKTALGRVTKALPRHSRLADLHKMIAEENAGHVEQIDPPEEPAQDEPSKWDLSIEYYGQMGVSAAQLLAWLDLGSADEVTEDHTDKLENLYRGIYERDQDALAVLGGMRSLPDAQVDGEDPRAGFGQADQ